MVGGHTYDDAFFDYINAGSTRSAQRVVPLLIALAAPASVLDVGSGAGAWLREWARADIGDYLGVDGDYVTDDQLLIPGDHFRRYDLSQAFSLDRKFDLVCSFEVAEHVAPPFADQFVDNLVRHGDVVAFSAATPGQGGEFHVNEQPYDYWRAKFNQRRYACYDAVRPVIVTDKTIEPWYRYNIFLFANPDGAKRLASGALETQLDPFAPAKDVSPLPWRLRRAVLSRLPRPWVEGLAGVKHRLTLASR